MQAQDVPADIAGGAADDVATAMLPPRSIRWQAGRLFLLDQTLLPTQVVEREQHDVEDVRASIRALRVRGAPAIGIAAAYGVVLGLAADPVAAGSAAAMAQAVQQRVAYLTTARPTAVNLAWALSRMQRTAQAGLAQGLDVAAMYRSLVAEAEAIHEEDRALCRAIGAAAVHLIRPGMRLLTHCNAGSLAVSELGTALAPMYLAHRRGIPFKVYAGETRPLLQGARLTAFELQRAGIDVSVICDSMVATLMAGGKIDLAIVGTDRVTANGDVINKIGTLGIAVLCRHFAVPFYVACPGSTIDLSIERGADVPIEEREPAEVTTIADTPVAPPGVGVFNPAFDVTPAALVTGLITERGLLTQPLAENLRKHHGASRRPGHGQ